MKKSASKINLITVTGPTASGKTGFAAQLAYRMDGEIISADSRQVYRQMNLGTGKDYQDYIVNGLSVPYHLIDIHDPGYKYNVFEFQGDFIVAYENIISNRKMPFLVGGTGLYIEAVLNGYQMAAVPINNSLRAELEQQDLDELVERLKSICPKLHNTTDTKNKKRTIRAIEIALFEQENLEGLQKFPDINAVILGVKYDRESRRSRISDRLKIRLQNGMIEEVESLLQKVTAEDLLFYGLEYKFITQYLTGDLTKQEMTSKLEIAIHQFAKRQMTWFRKMERSGANIHWIDGHLAMDGKLHRAKEILAKYGLSF